MDLTLYSINHHSSFITLFLITPPPFSSSLNTLSDNMAFSNSVLVLVIAAAFSTSEAFAPCSSVRYCGFVFYFLGCVPIGLEFGDCLWGAQVQIGENIYDAHP